MDSLLTHTLSLSHTHKHTHTLSLSLSGLAHALEDYLCKSDGRKVWYNVYDVGLHGNWDSVFGRNSLWLNWLLPSLGKPKGDGIRFATRRPPGSDDPLLQV